MEALVPAADGWEIGTVPAALPSNEVTVLHYAGVGLFAEVSRIDEDWPRVSDSTNAVVVLSMRMLPDVPSSKVIRALRRWARDLEKHGGRLFLAGVTPAALKVFERGGVIELVGEDGLFPATTKVFGALDAAVAHGRQWIAGRAPSE